MEEKDAVANMLSSAGLFFQHPSMEEYEPDVPYFNPHMLLRPGAEMPDIESLSISRAQDADTTVLGSSVLEEAGMAQIWRVFDTANEATNIGDVNTSGRLNSSLRE